MIKINKDSIRPFVASALFTIVFFAFYYFLINHFGFMVMWYITFTLLAVMVVIIGLVAEFLVLKSLFLIAAELSLIIFLAQSYCGVPNRALAGDNALKGLMVLGFLYIGFTFCRSLFKSVKEYYKEIEKGRWSKKISIVTVFLIFTITFIWQIYLVISPIILNLCIYK